MHVIIRYAFEDGTGQDVSVDVERDWGLQNDDVFGNDEPTRMNFIKFLCEAMWGVAFEGTDIDPDTVTGINILTMVL